ncbi:hypothetical protein [Aquibium oceanicum]|uniref:Uncharacterized protein n=1 Tax=Aquibium oceanicum TaxID=1670800 RepID=A0A1L3STI2_9HYPH|nr:hypothetical protein [Aquibium oceanicum]APH72635.1 hypothetical protein BSQ44_15670 [Aquibium oceanicum]
MRDDEKRAAGKPQRSFEDSSGAYLTLGTDLEVRNGLGSRMATFGELFAKADLQLLAKWDKR